MSACLATVIGLDPCDGVAWFGGDEMLAAVFIDPVGIAGPAGSVPVPLSVRAHAVTPAAGVLSLDLAGGNSFHAVISAAVTSVAFLNWPAAPTAQRITLYIEQGTPPHVIAGWPAAIRWPRGEAPALTAIGGAIDCLVFESFSAGAVIFGNVAGTDYKQL